MANLFVIQGRYGGGWEDVTAEENYHEARQRLREYNENESNYPHRLITRRVSSKRVYREKSNARSLFPQF